MHFTHMLVARQRFPICVHEPDSCDTVKTCHFECNAQPEWGLAIPIQSPPNALVVRFRRGKLCIYARSALIALFDCLQRSAAVRHPRKRSTEPPCQGFSPRAPSLRLRWLLVYRTKEKPEAELCHVWRQLLPP